MGQFGEVVEVLLLIFDPAVIFLLLTGLEQQFNVFSPLLSDLIPGLKSLDHK
jgi:hypothetical protein